MLDIPGHVLVVVGEDAAPVIIDPFHGGVAVQPEELVALLAAVTGGTPAVRHLAAMLNRAVLIRLLMNQATRAEQAGKGRRALDLYRRMNALAPDYGHAWWERARLELVDGHVVAARASLAAMLEVTRGPTLRARITDTMKAIVSA